MKKRILMLMAAICMICSFAAITVGAYTDYTANAQKLVSYILQKGIVGNDGRIVVSEIGRFGDTLPITSMQYDKKTKRITFGTVLHQGDFITLCYFDYDLSNASVIDNKIKVALLYSYDGDTVIIQNISFPFYINSCNINDKYTTENADIQLNTLGLAMSHPNAFDKNTIPLLENFERNAVSIIQPTLLNIELLVADTTESTLKLEDIGFASLNAADYLSNSTSDTTNNTTSAAYPSNNDTTIYAPDGRTAYIYHGDIEKFLRVGWYLYPVTTIYAPDGRTAVVETSSVEAYKAVGWNTVPTITDGVHTNMNYTANAQKLVNYIWQKGNVSNDGTISLVNTDDATGATVFTILKYDPKMNQIHFGYTFDITDASTLREFDVTGASTLCKFDYDVATASVVNNELDVGFFVNEDGTQKMKGVTLFFDARTYNKDEYFNISRDEVFGDLYYSNVDKLAGLFNSTVKTAIASFKIILAKNTDLSLEDLGFASINVETNVYFPSNGNTPIYASDGRMARVNKGDVAQYLQVGWYLYPVTTIYAPDGRTAVVEKSSVEAYKAVGWNTVPAITLYALNGSTINIWSSETAAYTAVGWYVGTTPITMYAPDGRTISVPIEQMTAYIGVGWSQYPIAA